METGNFLLSEKNLGLLEHSDSATKQQTQESEHEHSFLTNTPLYTLPSPGSSPIGPSPRPIGARHGSFQSPRSRRRTCKQSTVWRQNATQRARSRSTCKPISPRLRAPGELHAPSRSCTTLVPGVVRMEGERVSESGKRYNIILNIIL